MFTAHNFCNDAQKYPTIVRQATFYRLLVKVAQKDLLLKITDTDECFVFVEHMYFKIPQEYMRHFLFIPAEPFVKSLAAEKMTTALETLIKWNQFGIDIYQNLFNLDPEVATNYLLDLAEHGKIKLNFFKELDFNGRKEVQAIMTKNFTACVSLCGEVLAKRQPEISPLKINYSPVFFDAVLFDYALQVLGA